MIFSHLAFILFYFFLHTSQTHGVKNSNEIMGHHNKLLVKQRGKVHLGNKREQIDYMKSKTLTKKEEQDFKMIEKIEEKHSDDAIRKLHNMKSTIHSEISNIAGEREQQEIIARLNNERKHELDMEQINKIAFKKSKKDDTSDNNNENNNELSESDKVKLKFIDSAENFNGKMVDEKDTKRHHLSVKLVNGKKSFKKTKVISSIQPIYPLIETKRHNTPVNYLSEDEEEIQTENDQAKQNHLHNSTISQNQNSPTVFSVEDTDELGNKRTLGKNIVNRDDINRDKLNKVLSYYKSTHKDLSYRKSFIPKSRSYEQKRLNGMRNYIPT